MFINPNFLNKIMKKIYVGLLLAFMLALVLVFAFGSENPQESEIAGDNTLTGNSISDLSGNQVMINKQQSTFEFIGGKIVGKAHPGTFQEWEGYVYIDNEEVVGIQGIAQVSSVKTDSSSLDKHLQRDDFFNSEMYPEIKFTSTSVDSENKQIKGVLEMAGKSKELVVPVEFDGESISGKFSFSADEFFKYDALITEIEINFDFVY